MHSTHLLVVSQTSPPLQSGLFRQATQTCGWTIVSHTASGAVQSALALHTWLVHVPTEPSVLLQYLPVAQLSTPVTTRQPAAQEPVLVVVVSQ